MARRRGQQHSQELHDRVLVEPGPVRDVAARLGVSPSYVSKVRTRLRLTGQRTAKPRGGRRMPILAGRDELLRSAVSTMPEASLIDIQRWLLESHTIKVSVGALWTALRRLGLRT